LKIDIGRPNLERERESGLPTENPPLRLTRGAYVLSRLPIPKSGGA